MRSQFLFFSGKGGVGKTTMACVTAVQEAEIGLRTLIVTTDPASNLSDVFEQPIVEAHRAMLDLRDAGIPTQLVVANQVIPGDQATNPFFRSRRQM